MARREMKCGAVMRHTDGASGGAGFGRKVESGRDTCGMFAGGGKLRLRHLQPWVLQQARRLFHSAQCQWPVLQDSTSRAV